MTPAQKDAPSQAITAQTVTSQALKVRCPHCTKLYSVQKESLRIESSRFLCKSCEQPFWLPKADETGPSHATEIFGLKTAPLKPSRQGSSSSKSSPPAPQPQKTPKRLLLWKDLIDHFEDEKRHQDFIAFCDEEGRLTFACERYQSVLSAVGSDPLTEKYLKRVRSMIELKAKEEVKSSANQFRQITKAWGWFWSLAFVGAALMAMGYFVLNLKNVVGLGAAILFFAFTIRSYLKK